MSNLKVRLHAFMWELISPEVIETMFTSRDLVLHSVFFSPMCGPTSVSRTPLVPITHKQVTSHLGLDPKKAKQLVSS